MVFNTVLADATESEEPTIRNSNLLPVKQRVRVRFRSVASLSRSGKIFTPVRRVPPFLEWVRFSGVAELVDHILQLLSKENGNNCRRSLVCSQSVIISHIRGRFTEQICMAVYGLDDAG